MMRTSRGQGRPGWADGILQVWGVSVALICASALVLSCAEEDEDPLRAARAFAQASRASDIQSLLPRLERSTVARLEASAELASDHVGGRRNVEPWEMLQVVEVDRMGAIAKAELIDNDGTLAHVRLVRIDGGAHILELILEEGAWRVRLTPPGR